MVEVTRKKFQKRKEDFLCEHCAVNVIGNGYTNHCPQCLWSKHVDIFPGDRLSMCRGMMEPISVAQEKSGYLLVHRCIVCSYEKKNKSGEEDNFEALLALSHKRRNK